MANLGSFDFQAFEQFRDNLKGLERAWPGFMQECMTELANRLLAKVVPRTPVEEGELRRGWTIGQVNMTSAGTEIEVFNPVYYSPYIEYGHRTPNGQGWVEGQFMMTISQQELERELPAIMERKMKRLLERYLG